MTARRPRKTVSAAPNAALTPIAEPLKVGDATAAPEAPRRPQKPPRKERVPFGSYLDPDLQRRFKAACVLAGVEMQDALEEAVTAWLDQRAS